MTAHTSLRSPPLASTLQSTHAEIRRTAKRVRARVDERLYLSIWYARFASLSYDSPLTLDHSLPQ